jgi:transcriptional regulator with XRE-family HTH domain
MLREIRRRAGMTQAELAAVLHLSQSTISRAERGLFTPTREHLVWAAEQWAAFPTDPEHPEPNMHAYKQVKYAFNAFPQFSTKNGRSCRYVDR